MITTVLFDVGEVLMIGYKRSILAGISSLTGASEEEINRALREPMRLLNRGEIPFALFAQRVGEGIGKEIGVEDMERIVIEGVHPNAGAISVAKALKGRYRLAIASNNNHFTVEATRKDHPEMLALFGRCYFSCELGVGKPDREFFLRILSDLHADPGECLLIDDKEENCEAARALGMQAIRFEGREALLAQLRMLALLPGA